MGAGVEHSREAAPPDERAPGGPEGDATSRPRGSVPRRAALVLGVAAAAVLAANPATRLFAAWRRRSDPDYGDDIPLLFDVNTESTVPTWFSVALLLMVSGVALLLLVLARSTAVHGEWWRWGVLAGLFAAMSLDESAAIHERLGGGVASDLDLGGGGLLRHAWVVVGAPLALALVATVVWAVAGLASTLRRGVLVGLGVYLGGALGLEALSGWMLDRVGDGMAYAAVTWAEEGAEMAGTIIVVCSLLGALDLRTSDGVLRVARASSPR